MSFNSSMLDKPLQNPLVSHGGLMYTKPQDGEPRLNKTVAEDLPPRDETDPSSIGPKLKPVQRQHCGHFWERGWSAYGLIPVCVDGHLKCLTLKSSTGVSRNLALMDVPAQLISTVTGPCSSSIYTNTVLYSLTGSGRNHSTPIHKKQRERVCTGEPPHIVHLTYLSLKKQSYSVSGKEPLNRQIISPCCHSPLDHSLCPCQVLSSLLPSHCPTGQQGNLQFNAPPSFYLSDPLSHLDKFHPFFLLLSLP